MVSNKHPNEAKKAALTNKNPGHLNKQPPKPSSSNKTTHGSLTSTSASSGQGPTVSQGYRGTWGGNRDAGYGNGQREAWALRTWLEQGPRDEPWRAASRRS
ncbi:MAG: hypothetical protein ASARMPRED_002615 [Alectoria sarmentosa]|nr:MAG: hypothetical protein ASARMPRED_002615 [Alectoria sarmentosa]